MTDDGTFQAWFGPSFIELFVRDGKIEILCSSCPDDQSSSVLTFADALRLSEWLRQQVENSR